MIQMFLKGLSSSCGTKSVNRGRMSDFEPLNVVGVATALILFFPPRWSALSEMESMLLSVAKDRKAQRKQALFVDALLQSNFTERQVNAHELLLYILSAFTEVRKKTLKSGLFVSDHGGLHGVHFGWMCHRCKL